MKGLTQLRPPRPARRGRRRRRLPRLRRRHLRHRRDPRRQRRPGHGLSHGPTPSRLPGSQNLAPSPCSKRAPGRPSVCWRLMAPMGAQMRQQTEGGTVWAVVRRQHGVISRRQLLEFGLTSKAIKHRLRIGKLRSVARGVYAVGRPELTREGHWMAAILSCGDGAVLSHSSAAALWEIGEEWERGIEVSIPRTAHLRRSELVLHRRKRLYAPDRAVHHRVPVTSPAMTIVDLACRLCEEDIVRMVNDADKRRLVRVPALRRFAEVHPRQDGVGRIKEILDRRTFRASDSKLEQWFLPIVESIGLPDSVDPAEGQRLQGRLLLAAARACGRDRRAAATTARRPSRRRIGSATRSTPPPG